MPPALVEVAQSSLKLGLTSFGGPVAHIGFHRSEFVERRRWLDDAEFADLVALCQFLPGPASSQVIFAVGMKRAGLAGAIVASVCFLAPSAIAMILFAYGVGRVGDLEHAGWLHGLKMAAVAVVAQAVATMGVKLCPDAPRRTLALVVAAALIVWPGAVVQLGVIAAGALLGWTLYRNALPTGQGSPASPGGHVGAVAALVSFELLLVLPAAVVSLTGSKSIAVFDAFYRSGALVFGGGHVVLPLLRAEVVPPGWIGDDAFLAGYGAAQAVPGPLFTFAGYLGTIIQGGWPGGVMCLMALFLPGWLLIGGALPFWQRLRGRPEAQAALVGANAAVVGVLLAALWRPVLAEGIRGPADIVAAAIALGALQTGKCPPWAVVLAMAAAGHWLLPYPHPLDPPLRP